MFHRFLLLVLISSSFNCVQSCENLCSIFGRQPPKENSTNLQTSDTGRPSDAAPSNPSTMGSTPVQPENPPETLSDLLCPPDTPPVTMPPPTFPKQPHASSVPNPPSSFKPSQPTAPASGDLKPRPAPVSLPGLDIKPTHKADRWMSMVTEPGKVNITWNDVPNVHHYKLTVRKASCNLHDLPDGLEVLRPVYECAIRNHGVYAITVSAFGSVDDSKMIARETAVFLKTSQSHIEMKITLTHPKTIKWGQELEVTSSVYWPARVTYKYDYHVLHDGEWLFDYGFNTNQVQKVKDEDKKKFGLGLNEIFCVGYNGGMMGYRQIAWGYTEVTVEG